MSVCAWDGEPVLDTNIRVTVGASGDTTFTLKKSWIMAAKARKLADPIYGQMFECVKTISSFDVEQIKPGRDNNPSNVKRIERLMPKESWDFLFPICDSSYTYTKFLQAAGKFPAFCGDYENKSDEEADAIARKSLATAFAHFTQETGGHDKDIEKTQGIPQWRQGLLHIRELGCSADGQTDCLYNLECTPTDPNSPTWQLKRWPCPKDANGNFPRYYGRGAKQLSYHYNYGAFSEAMFGDATVLLEDPELVADTWLNLASAIFFFVTPRPPKPSMLHVIDGTWEPSHWDSAVGILPNFGTTINIINGGVECGDSTTEKAQAINRIAYYREYANYFDVEVPENEELGCKDQVRFNSPLVRDSGGMAKYPVQFTPDPSWDNTRPWGNFECIGVAYETAYSAFRDGDYLGCVVLGFGKDGDFPHYRDRNIVVIDDMDDVGISKQKEVPQKDAHTGIYLVTNPAKLSTGNAEIVVVTGKQAHVQISILDPIGNLIDMQQTSDVVKEAAMFNWDLRNMSGKLVHSGSYIAVATITYNDGTVQQFKEPVGVKKDQ